MIRLITIFLCVILSNSFLNIKFGIKNNFHEREIILPISYKKIPLKKNNIINSIEGFYGLIGPEEDKNNSNNKSTDLFELFNKNGIIQGVFISNGSINFVKKYIRTDKLLYEEKNGVIPFTHNNLLLFETLKNFNLLPNIFGLANTALLNYNNKTYALNERDFPYELDINFTDSSIYTKKKITLPFLKNFLAHSKINNNLLETIDYSSFSSRLNFIKMDKNLNLIKNLNLKKKYVSMIHDFISLKDHIIYIDNPVILDKKLLLNTTIPLKYNKKLNSFLYIIDKKNGKMKEINITSIFLFHYGNFYENNEQIEIYACLYDDFDFTKPKNNYGRYRKIIINKKNYSVSIEKNIDLEKYSLDFPIIYKNYTILTHSNNLVNRKFIIVKNFKLYKKINFNKNICGEASVIEIDKKPYIICFTKDNKNSFLTIQGIDNNHHLSIPINYNITLGFHSIFISK